MRVTSVSDRYRRIRHEACHTAQAPTNEADRRRFMSMINEHLSELYEYVRHALAARRRPGPHAG